MNESEYKHRLTVAVPEAMIENANHLSVAVGESAGDFYTFTSADFEDTEGNKYSLISGVVTDLLFQYAGSIMQRRTFAPEEWDFYKASAAQSIIQLWFGPTEDIPEQPMASPDKILGVVGEDTATIVLNMGLSRIYGGGI